MIQLATNHALYHQLRNILQQLLRNAKLRAIISIHSVLIHINQKFVFRLVDLITILLRLLDNQLFALYLVIM